MINNRYVYKAKRVDNGEWVQGSYLYDYGRNIHYIFANEIACPNCVNDCRKDYEIDPSTICQCTGLKDKNGKPIWENDIADCSVKRGVAFHKCLVLWNESKARFDVRAMGCDFPMTLDECAGDISISGSDYEVVGNRFDNIECAVMTDSEVLKQIPMEVVDIHKPEDEEEAAVYGDAMFGRCPKCDEYVSSVWNECYCGDCGQKLDWGCKNERE